ncbi:MAG TPA: PEP-CTERM sorting domain-containing protein [Phycisphaerales bacterium]|nr:PEP-CTERM sorting domain-containing protein [Phycisphaerales bacterium]
MKTLIGAALVAALAGVASADISTETAQFGGYININLATGQTTYSDSNFSTRATTIYSNTASAASFGVSSTDLNSTWGDDFTGVGSGGTLSGQQFTVFNSGTSLGSLLTATVTMSYYDSVGAFLGGFNGNVNFGTGLNVGFYSVVTFSGLESLGINLTSSNLIVTQKVASKTGLASRLGIVSMNPVNVGFSDIDMYVSSSTIGGGVAGWYTFGTSGPANMGLQVDVIPAPASVALLGMGGLVAARRRR